MPPLGQADQGSYGSGSLQIGVRRPAPVSRYGGNMQHLIHTYGLPDAQRATLARPAISTAPSSPFAPISPPATERNSFVRPAPPIFEAITNSSNRVNLTETGIMNTTNSLRTPGAPSSRDRSVNPLQPIADIDSVFSQRDTHTGNVFWPSRAVLEQQNYGPIAPPISGLRTPPSNIVINPNYRGQVTLGSNQDPFIPEFLSCAVWIEGLPPHATLKDLLAVIKNIGRVYSTHLNGPISGRHPTSAAKLVFFDPQAAMTFLTRANTAPGISVLGHTIQARYNRHRYSAHTKPYESRVLRIQGPRQYINYPFLIQYINALMVADVLDVFELDVGDQARAMGISAMEWHFGSVLAQAAALKLAIELEPALRWCCQVVYCQDPCE